ncbi:MAG: ArsA family ATPase [Fervidicoccaceae archaeon]
MALEIASPTVGSTALIVGKGGVGKTTFSALLAIFTSQEKKTFVSSIDPAHHLGDVLGMKLEHKAKKIRENLYANEADIDELIHDYLNTAVEVLRNNYKDVTALNLDKYFNVLREAPGIEIESMFQYIVNLKRRHRDFAIIIDTPATSITARLVSLPWVQAAWVDNLIELRSKIAGFKETIESVKAGRRVQIEDPILMELMNLKEEIEENKKAFQDKTKIKFIGVTTAELLPINDILRLKDSLEEKEIYMSAVVLNRYEDNEQNRSAIKTLKSSFGEIPIVKVPKFEREPIGINELEKALRDVEVV